MELMKVLEQPLHRRPSVGWYNNIPQLPFSDLGDVILFLILYGSIAILNFDCTTMLNLAVFTEVAIHSR